MTSLSFFVDGDPKSQPRGRACRRGNHAGIYDPGTADGWKASVRAAAKNGWDGVVFTGPLRVDVAVYFKRPKSHYFTGKRSDVLRLDAPSYHTTKPDRDNLDKAILDAITNAGIWYDDSQVCAGTITKSYVQFIAGADITITAL
jgi:Holliday junction resolvase RusA-like endonuclease